MSRQIKYPEIAHLSKQDRNAYARAWRKLNPKTREVKDEWRRLEDQLFDELPNDVVPLPNYPTYYARPNGEIWRDTRGTESAVKCGKERVLRLKATYNPHNGYWFVQPYQGTKRRVVHLHKLILTAFVGDKPHPDMECHHKDADTSNNHIDNLMWVTRQENIDFVPRHKFRGDKIKLGEGRKISESKHHHLYPEVVRLSKLGMKVRPIADELGMNVGAVWQIFYALQRRGEL